MAELYAEADGYAQNIAFGGTWNNLRDAGTSSLANSTLTKRQFAVSGYLLTGFFTLPNISRTFIRFDCSGISSTLSEASLKIYGYEVSGRGDDEDFWIVKSTALTSQIGGDYVVATSDFDAITGWDTSSPTTDGSGNGDQTSNVTLYSDMYDVSGGWSTSGYNTVPLNAQARADLVSQDTFTICIIANSDLKDLPRSFFFGAVQDTTGLYFTEETGTSKDPYIDYTVAETTVANNSVFFGTSF